MFDELVESTAKKKTHKRWTVILSAIIQVVIVSIFILIPLIYTEALAEAVSDYLFGGPRRRLRLRRLRPRLCSIS